MIELYGIANCDTVKKARIWLADKHIEYLFQDFKKVNIEPATLSRWIDQLALDNLINKRGTTWRKLTDEDKHKCESAEFATPVILNNLSIIKRPLIINNGQAVLIGFSANSWKEYFHTN